MFDKVKSTLPWDWLPCYLEDGRIFFINDTLKKTTWLHPTANKSIKTGHTSLHGSLSGWDFGIAENGRKYYIDHINQTTTWTPPIAKRNETSVSKITPYSAQGSDPVYVNLQQRFQHQHSIKQSQPLCQLHIDLISPNETGNNVKPKPISSLASTTEQSTLTPSNREKFTIKGMTDITKETKSISKGSGKKLASSLAKLFFKAGGTGSERRAKEGPALRCSDVTVFSPESPGRLLTTSSHNRIVNFGHVDSEMFGGGSKIQDGGSYGNYRGQTQSVSYPVERSTSVTTTMYAPAQEIYLLKGWLFFLEKRPVTHWVKKWVVLKGTEMSVYKTCPTGGNQLDPSSRGDIKTSTPQSIIRFVASLRHSQDFQQFVTYQKFSLKIPSPATPGTIDGDIFSPGSGGGSQRQFDICASSRAHPTDHRVGFSPAVQVSTGMNGNIRHTSYSPVSESPGVLSTTPIATTTMYSFALEIEIYHEKNDATSKNPTLRSATKTELVTMATLDPRDRDSWVQSFTSVISSARLSTLRGETAGSAIIPSSEMSNGNRVHYKTPPRSTVLVNRSEEFFRTRARTEVNLGRRPATAKLTVNHVQDYSVGLQCVNQLSASNVVPPIQGSPEKLIGKAALTQQSRDTAANLQGTGGGGRGSPLRDDLVLLLIRNRRELKRLQNQMEVIAHQPTGIDGSPLEYYDHQGNYHKPNNLDEYVSLKRRIERYQQAIGTLENLLFHTDTGHRGSQSSSALKVVNMAAFTSPPATSSFMVTTSRSNKYSDLARPLTYDSDCSPVSRPQRKVNFSPKSPSSVVHYTKQLVSTTSLRPVDRVGGYADQVRYAATRCDNGLLHGRARNSIIRSPPEIDVTLLRHRFKDLMSAVSSLSIQRPQFEGELEHLKSDLSKLSGLRQRSKSFVTDLPSHRYDEDRDGPDIGITKLERELNASAQKTREFYDTLDRLGDAMDNEEVGAEDSKNNPGDRSTGDHVIYRRRGRKDSSAAAAAEFRKKRSLSLPGPDNYTNDSPVGHDEYEDKSHIIQVTTTTNYPSNDKYHVPVLKNEISKDSQSQYASTFKNYSPSGHYNQIKVSPINGHPYKDLDGRIISQTRNQISIPAFIEANHETIFGDVRLRKGKQQVTPGSLSTPKVQRRRQTYYNGNCSSSNSNNNNISTVQHSCDPHQNFPDIVRSSVSFNTKEDTSPTSTDLSIPSFSSSSSSHRRRNNGRSIANEISDVGAGKDINLETIDRELSKPNKIYIPQRLEQSLDEQAHDATILDQETEEEKNQKTLKKEYLRNLLSNYNVQDMYEHIHMDGGANGSYSDHPKNILSKDSPASQDFENDEKMRFKESCREERLRRQKLLSLNEMLAKEVVAKSKLMMAKSKLEEKNRLLD